MGYTLGVDLGNTHVAAAVAHGSKVEMCALEESTLVMPAVVYLGEDGAAAVGERAVRRELANPDRVARGFKRRLGDPTPVTIGGRPHTIPELLGMQLRSVLTKVTEREGEPPERVVLTRPAVWEQVQLSMFDEVPGLAGLADADMISEPEAVVMHYAESRRLANGRLVAVYDLGGGTFEVTLVRTLIRGVEIVGAPQGIARLGGLDFDEALIDFVDSSLAGPLGRLDPGDPGSPRTLARLREQCVNAKEVLSDDDVVDVPLELVGEHLEARVTRADFENLIRVKIESTVLAVRSALRTAQVSPADLDGILLVGGSSRIPLVARMVSQALECPVRINIHPKHAVALGAAAAPGRTGNPRPVSAAPPQPLSPPAPTPSPLPPAVPTPSPLPPAVPSPSRPPPSPAQSSPQPAAPTPDRPSPPSAAPALPLPGPPSPPPPPGRPSPPPPSSRPSPPPPPARPPAGQLPAGQLPAGQRGFPAGDPADPTHRPTSEVRRFVIAVAVLAILAISVLALLVMVARFGA